MAVFVLLISWCFCCCCGGFTILVLKTLGCFNRFLTPREIVSAVQDENDGDENSNQLYGRNGQIEMSNMETGDGKGSLMPKVMKEKLNHLSNTPTITKMSKAINKMSNKLGIDPNNNMELGAYSQVGTGDDKDDDDDDDVGTYNFQDQEQGRGDQSQFETSFNEEDDFSDFNEFANKSD